MDLHLSTRAATATSATATDGERAAVDSVLGPPTSGWEGGQRRDVDGHVARGGRATRARRDLLLPALHALQASVGWISPGALDYVSARLSVPPAEAFGVASFYAMFSTTPRPPVVVHLCDDVACQAAGVERLCELLDAELGPAGTPSTDGPHVAWLRSPCLGQCDHAPAALVQRAGGGATAGRDRTVVALSESAVLEIVAARADGPDGPGPGAPAPPPRVPQAEQAEQAETAESRAGLHLLRRVGAIDPGSLDDYRAHGGYAALRAAIALGPAGVIREVDEARLLGRGGAAFPTGVKWRAVAQRPERPHYLVCNADESEPGTFKDRVMMEQDPFALIEAMTIAGLATGCERAFLYIRGEYPRATDRVRAAIAQARARGLIGEDVMGEGFGFDIEVRRGAGAYICGEETALFNSIEGYRGEPRNKPPFPVERGLFGKPTVVNNVETLLNVLPIVLSGGAAYAATGTPDSTGTRLWCLSGHVARPGLYEAEFGTTLREMLSLAGGVRDGRTLRAVLLGGAAGTFLGPEQLDLPLTFEAARSEGATLGSGAVVVFDETTDLDRVLLRIARFFRDESCGQCVPCRVGTARQEELLHRLSGGRTTDPNADLALLDDLAGVMRDASICGLGQTAANAIQSAMSRLKVFPAEGRGQGR